MRCHTPPFTCPSGALPPLTLPDPGHERGGVSGSHTFHHHTLARYHRGVLWSCHNDHVLLPGGHQGPWREGRPAGSLTISIFICEPPPAPLVRQVGPEQPAPTRQAGRAATWFRRAGTGTQRSFPGSQERSNLVSNTPAPLFPAKRTHAPGRGQSGS